MVKKKKSKYPNLVEEKKLWQRGFSLVSGIDEAGRGSLAGPVTAAAVILNCKRQIANLIKGVKDSKKLTPKKREELYKLIVKSPFIEWGIGIVSEKIIDKINIKNAAELAMEKAVKKLKHKPDFLLIDGNHLANYKLQTTNHKLIVKADEKVFSCASASILAKVSRDRLMAKYDKKYPQYGFKKHKGYPSPLHLRMLEKYGPSKIHRQTFSPVKNAKLKAQSFGKLRIDPDGFCVNPRRRLYLNKDKARTSSRHAS